jgi:hypothetical protein
MLDVTLTCGDPAPPVDITLCRASTPEAACGVRALDGKGLDITDSVVITYTSTCDASGIAAGTCVLCTPGVVSTGTCAPSLQEYVYTAVSADGLEASLAVRATVLQSVASVTTRVDMTLAGDNAAAFAIAAQVALPSSAENAVLAALGNAVRTAFTCPQLSAGLQQRLAITFTLQDAQVSKQALISLTGELAITFGLVPTLLDGDANASTDATWNSGEDSDILLDCASTALAAVSVAAVSTGLLQLTVETGGQELVAASVAIEVPTGIDALTCSTIPDSRITGTIALLSMDTLQLDLPLLSSDWLVRVCSLVLDCSFLLGRQLDVCDVYLCGTVCHPWTCSGTFAIHLFCQFHMITSQHSHARLAGASRPFTTITSLLVCAAAAAAANGGCYRGRDQLLGDHGCPVIRR